LTRHAPKSKHGRGHPQRKPTPWPAGTDLKSREGLDAFLCTLIEKAWTNNPLDPRTVGSINNTTRLLLESRGWIQKTPLNIIQAQTVVKLDAQKLVNQMTPEEQEVVSRAIARIESEASPS
jgi:hypothetical protein